MTCRLSHTLYHMASEIKNDLAKANRFRHYADQLDRTINALGAPAAHGSYAFGVCAALYRVQKRSPNFEFDHTWVEQYAVPQTRPKLSAEHQDFFKTLARRITRG